MKITLSEIKQTNLCVTPELRQRVQETTKGKKTIFYRALCIGREVAVVALDRWPELDRMVLYELYVLQDLRRQGFGGAVLSAVECMAIREGFSTIKLSPHPLDDDISPKSLTEWYSQRGYQIDSAMPSEMEKRISKLSQ